MGFWDIFKSKKKQAAVETPSPEQVAFAKIALELISPTVEQYGFALYSKEIKEYSTNIIFRKDKQYIQISSTSYPTDYPYFYNIILGEGSSDDFFESDWNSTAIWHLARIVNPGTEVSSYNFPTGGDAVKYSLEQAHKHLVKYGESFLKGDLTLFYEARKKMNEGREPYKIYTANKDGSYEVNIDPGSAEQKDKYS